MTAVSFTVRGLPAPQGSKRHVGNGVMVESSKAVRPWREAVRAECQRAATAPLAGSLFAEVIFYLPRPKGHYGTGRNAGKVRQSAPLRPAGKPDLDKLLRAVMDGLTEGGAWKDDSQVTSLRTRKLWASGENSPGCRITVYELEN